MNFHLKNHQKFTTIIKVILLIISLVFLYYSTKSINFNNMIKLSSRQFNLPIFLTLMVFSLVNWLIEITKWHYLIKKIQRQSFKKSSLQVLKSFYFACFTPARLGEYGAKSYFFKKKLRKKIWSFNLIHHSSQMLVTILMASIGVLIIDKPIIGQFLKTDKLNIKFLLILSVIVGIFLIKKTQVVKKFQNQINKNLTLTFQLLGLSLLKYFVFTHQFYILILIFSKHPTNYLSTLSLIAVFYGLSSILPLFQWFEPVIKSSLFIGLSLLLKTNLNSFECLLIINLMWSLNTLIPFIIGAILLIKNEPIKKHLTLP